VQAIHLNDKRAVVTGAASGIGLAIAQTFAQNGASVVLLDLDEAKTSAAAKAIGPAATALACDVTSESSVAAAFTQIGHAYRHPRQLRRHRPRRQPANHHARRLRPPLQRQRPRHLPLR
jgi:NAD(P)-dependent dehydrogenase (short-subunit alcohol dehydrogenase family)